jgi:hypothetical protein
LWRKARRTKKLPTPSELSAARALLGYKSIILDAKAGTVELRKTGMKLDFGAIGKGYAADEAIAVLRSRGITRALVAASGDIVAGDPPPGKEGWRIGIASLQRPDNPPERFITLKNAACSTAETPFNSSSSTETILAHRRPPPEWDSPPFKRDGHRTEWNHRGRPVTACLIGPERVCRSSRSSGIGRDLYRADESQSTTGENRRAGRVQILDAQLRCVRVD